MAAIFTRKIVIYSLLIAAGYLILVTYLMNYRFVIETIFGNYPINYKLNILIGLLEGLNTNMTNISLGVLIVIATLTGLNLALLMQRLSLLKSSKKLRLMVGGSSIVGIVGSGCAACGLSMLALIGLGGSLTYLPFRGTELSIITVILLAYSLYILTKNQSKYCPVVKPDKLIV